MGAPGRVEHPPPGTFRDQVSAALDIPSSGLSPQRAMVIARDVLPRETVVSCDAGASRLLVVQKWQAYGPREFLTSNGLASMGYAVPGAIAARLAWPERPVVAFAGDGGFLMAFADALATAVASGRTTVIGARIDPSGYVAQFNALREL